MNMQASAGPSRAEVASTPQRPPRRVEGTKRGKRRKHIAQTFTAVQTVTEGVRRHTTDTA